MLRASQLRRPLVALFILIVPTLAQARWATTRDVGSVLQLYALSIRVDADGSSTTEYEQIWRIQSEEGKINGSVKEIEYNAFTDKIEILEAKTINGPTQVPVSASAIEDRDKGEAKDYDALKVKSLVFPQVQVGSVLVFKYRERSTPPPVPNQWSIHFVYPVGILVEQVKIDVKSERPIVYTAYDPQEILRVSGGKNSVSVSLRKPIPGQVIGEKDSYFHPARFSTFFATTEPDWKKYFQPLVVEYEKILDEDLPRGLHPEVESWKKTQDPRRQIEQVMEFMSRGFRYFGDWRRVRGGFFPRHLSEIEKSRYGDCKDLSTILSAILRRLGFDAHVSLVERGISAWINKPPDPIANVGMFNHAIVKAEKGGKVWWLDPTNEVVSLTPYADIAGKPAFVISSATTLFDRIPTVTPDQYGYRDDETYHFQPNGDVKVDVKADYQGMAAFRVAYGLLTSPLDKMLFDVVDYYSEGQDLESFKFSKTSQTVQKDRLLADLHFDFVYWTQSATYTTPAGLFFQLKDGGLSGAFYETKDRESDLQLADMPLAHHSVKILKNVKGVGDPLLVCDLKSPWMDIKRQVRSSGSDIEVVQDAVVRVPAILKREYSSREFIQLRDQARKCFYRTGLIFRPQ